MSVDMTDSPIRVRVTDNSPIPQFPHVKLYTSFDPDVLGYIDEQTSLITIPSQLSGSHLSRSGLGHVSPRYRSSRTRVTRLDGTLTTTLSSALFPSHFQGVITTWILQVGPAFQNLRSYDVGVKGS